MSHVVCSLNVEADRATFTWSEGPASFTPYTLDGLTYREFKETAEAARERLADLIKDYLYAEENVPRAAFALAEAGPLRARVPLGLLYGTYCPQGIHFTQAAPKDSVNIDEDTLYEGTTLGVKSAPDDEGLR
jgi:hypothetical protein